MIVDVPTPTPVTVPSVPTVAIAVLVLLHVPPVVASVSAIVEPLHIYATPLVSTIATGCVFTVTIAVA